MNKNFLPEQKFSVNNVDYKLEVLEEHKSLFERLYSCRISDKSSDAVLNLTTLVLPNQHLDNERLLTAIVNKCSDAIGKDGLLDLKKKFTELTSVELCGYKFGVECVC